MDLHRHTLRRHLGVERCDVVFCADADADSAIATFGRSNGRRSAASRSRTAWWRHGAGSTDFEGSDLGVEDERKIVTT